MSKTLMLYFRILCFVTGCALLTTVTIINVQADRIHYGLQLALLYTGIVLVIASMAGIPLAVRLPLSAAFQQWWRSQEARLLCGILILALLLRVWQLGELVRTYVDEILPASHVTQLRDDPYRLILQPMDNIFAFPWVYASWTRISTDGFGSNLFGLRLVNAIAGTMTVLALYGLARQWFDRRIALLAALLLAVLPPHIHMSRVGYINPQDALYGTLALYLLGRAWLHNRQHDWVLSGAALGATAYFHESGKLLFPLLILIWCVLHLFAALRLRRWRGICMMLVSALLVALPVLITFLAVRGTLLPRMESLGMMPGFWQQLLLEPNSGEWWAFYFSDMLAPALLHYVALPDGSELYYGGQTALLLPWMVIPFLIGCIVLVMQLRKPAASLLLLWLLGTAFGNSLLDTFLTGNNHFSARFIIALPALALVTAIGTFTLLKPVEKVLAYRPVLQRRLLYTFVATLTISQLVYYFAVHIPQYNLQIRQRDFDLTDALERATQLPEITQIYIITRVPRPELAEELLTRFWGVRRELTMLHPQQLYSMWWAALPKDRPLAFFIAPDDERSRNALETHLDIQGPYASPHPIHEHLQYELWFANE
jgi:4-amino-4-deoxy-L-arabinose transferase-like glycosyltransferase